MSSIPGIPQHLFMLGLFSCALLGCSAGGCAWQSRARGWDVPSIGTGAPGFLLQGLDVFQSVCAPRPCKSCRVPRSRHAPPARRRALYRHRDVDAVPSLRMPTLETCAWVFALFIFGPLSPVRARRGVGGRALLWRRRLSCLVWCEQAGQTLSLTTGTSLRVAQAVPIASPIAGGTGLQQAGTHGAGVQHCFPRAQQGHREPLSPSRKAGRRALRAVSASQGCFAQWAWHTGEPSISARSGLAAPADAGHLLQVARNAVPFPVPGL